jgi:hypothetical protein
MDECSWVKGTKTRTSKKERKESKNPDTTGSMRDVWQKKFRSTSGESKKEKWWRDSDVRTRREKASIGWKERKEEERREILNEDEREIRWMKEIRKWREMIEKEKGEDRKRLFLEICIWNWYFGFSLFI